MLVEVDDDYDFNLEDHNLSAALAVMFPIDEAAGTAMGATEAAGSPVRAATTPPATWTTSTPWPPRIATTM